MHAPGLPGKGGRVQDEGAGRSRQGAVTVLALLFSLLLGYSPAAAASLEVERGAVRLGKTEAGKASLLLRSGGRLQSDEHEGDEPLAAPPARIVTFSLSRRPATAAAAAGEAGIGERPARAYRARAPPAA
jgi:hypothetical protein